VLGALVSTLAWADEIRPIPRIGVLLPPLTDPLGKGLTQGLRELGYIEGKTIVIEWKRSTGLGKEMQSLATELARSKVDIIVTPGSQATRAALDATHTIPVVFEVGDPVGSGFAANLANPGGNATGVSVQDPELIAKRLELLQQTAPRARRIVYLMNSSNPMAERLVNETEKAARTLGVQLVVLDARSDAELDADLSTFSSNAPGALLIAPDLLFVTNRTKIAHTVRKSKVPTMVASTEYFDTGILMSYGPNLEDAMHRLAVYVDKILKGAKPAELPIEQLAKYKFVVDLRAARAEGITVPQSVLERADQVIR
jgi:putative ABC transport system substrate-binding protein